MPLSTQSVADALKKVIEPELRKDIVTLNLVRDVAVDGRSAIIAIELLNPATAGEIERAVTAVVTELGAQRVRVDFTGSARSAGASVSSPGGAVAGGPTGNSAGGATATGRATAPVQGALPQVKQVIAVGAGKGGVGKSTIALNLAIGLQRRGAKVGLMDGDIYGPSMPTMLGISGQPPKVDGNFIIPHQVHGIHAITIGSLVESDAPLIWRGPKAHGAFKQLLIDNTRWPELDYLIVDLPPGTGDVPLTLGQLLSLSGAVVVATPQQVALDDAVRAVKMFQQLGSPVLGLVENMSYFVDDNGAEHDIFGRGGTRKAAERLGLSFLGEVPMYTRLRVNSDEGRPHANYEGGGGLAEALTDFVNNVVTELDEQSSSVGPTLEIV